MRFSSPALWFFVLCGAAAGWLVAGVVPDGLRTPFLHTQDFKLARKDGQPAEVTEARWMFLPFLFGDFDLQMDVELAEGADFDVMVRQVEPRLVGENLLPFQGRFSVLRLSTVGEGNGWRGRDDALLGPRHGGVGLAPGYLATVWIEGRGRELTANVAGKAQGHFVADDEYGMFALVARGGNAVVHNLTIKNHGQPLAWMWSRWTWVALGTLATLLVGVVALRRGLGPPWFVTSPLPMLLVAWLVARRADLDLAFPSPLAMGLLLGGSVLVAAARLGRPLITAVVAVVAVMLLVDADRRFRHDTRAIDAVFGVDSGAQPSEAHAQLVRGPGGLHDVGQKGKCVFLLGGQLLYDRGQPAEHLELLVGRELRAALRQPVVVPCLPTVDGYTAQQWRLFTACFTGYHPAVLVLGIPRDEMAIEAATGQRRSTPEQVKATIAAARTHADQNGSKFVLFADSGLPDDLHSVVRDAAAAGVPVVTAADGAAPADIAKQLAAAIVPLLSP